MKKFYYLIIPALFLAACAGGAPSGDYQSYLQTRGIGLPGKNSVNQCHGYGCRFITPVTLTDKEWKKVAKIFKPKAKNAEQERKRIAKAIGQMERIIGPKTGTDTDIKGTFKELGNDQLDCVDESTNTTSYLVLFHQKGLLKFHTPGGPTARVPIIHAGRWPHQTAVIQETKTGKFYAVDSWFQDNGKDADIIDIETWKSGWKPANIHEFL